ncbi:MAG: 1,4-dihydroxy-6-naphthoate synthase [Lachnospiraceae bacterium]|nr:1,4-dihydroxy-6-naphthoate synthase [Lachnospiraceae bacterium]
MHEDLYCKVYLDTSLTYEEIFSIVVKYIGGKKEALTYIIADWCEVSIQKNKEYNVEQYLLDTDDFVYWKYYLDIEALEVGEGEYIKKISDLLRYLKTYCKGVIAACDFEEELNV